MMWSSNSNDNPWRPFRCLSATRCASSPEISETKRRQNVGQNGLHGSSEHDMSNKHRGIQQTQDAVTIKNNLRNFDDDGSANIACRFLCSCLRNVITCDKQTQTDFSHETFVTRDACLRVAIKKVGNSKSCESFAKKCSLKPRPSRSYEVGNTVYQNTESDRQTTVSKNNISPSFRTLEETNDTISPLFQKGNPDNCLSKSQNRTNDFSAGKSCFFSSSGHAVDTNHGGFEKLSPIEVNEQEYASCADSLSDIDHVAIEINVDQQFKSDKDSDMQNMSCQEKSNNYKNQWSPFHVDRDSARMQKFYDYRQPDNVSLVSIRSFCSTTSDEEDDSYEKIDWNQYTDDYKQEKICRQRRSEAYNTPPTTPTLDLSALDGYHTAPNSPKYLNSQTCLKSQETISTGFCVIDAATGYTNCYFGEKYINDDADINKVVDSDVTSHNIANNASKPHYDQSLCCRCGKATEPDVTVEGWTLAEEEHKENDHQASFEQSRRKHGLRLPDSKTLQLETPPLISVSSLHYEADLETGRAKVIGRGSFGQVYKARFSDPMLYHLPIVIKEFNEEFTDSKEIIDEAKRLLYLQDTGYVPICYGLLCFGSPNEPKYGIVQEYVGTGLTLEQMLWDQYELPLEFWFRIVIQCCEGLARFHDKGILLNDIKTNNILLESVKKSVKIRYIDFGLATDMRGKRYKNTKSLEDFVYLAPEVRQKGKITNVASDIYSLGFILEQINKYTGMHELTVVARLCMDWDPDKRLPVRSAAELIKDHMCKLGYDPLDL